MKKSLLILVVMALIAPWVSAVPISSGDLIYYRNGVVQNYSDIWRANGAIDSSVQFTQVTAGTNESFYWASGNKLYGGSNGWSNPLVVGADITSVASSQGTAVFTAGGDYWQFNGGVLRNVSATWRNSGSDLGNIQFDLMTYGSGESAFWASGANLYGSTIDWNSPINLGSEITSIASYGNYLYAIAGGDYYFFSNGVLRNISAEWRANGSFMGDIYFDLMTYGDNESAYWVSGQNIYGSGIDWANPLNLGVNITSIASGNGFFMATVALADIQTVPESSSLILMGLGLLGLLVVRGRRA